MPVERDNPYGNYNFIVEITGVDNPPHAGFSEVSGLGMEVTPIEYRAGSDKTNTTRKIPGLSKFANVVLKRGITGSTAMYEWMKDVRDGSDSIRQDVTIRMLDEQRQPVITWKLSNAWPAKICGPELKATGNEVAIESFELTHEGVTIE